MKIYECKYCGKVGTRHDIRKCIMTHRKTEKRHGQGKEKNQKSVISQAMVRREL